MSGRKRRGEVQDAPSGAKRQKRVTRTPVVFDPGDTVRRRRPAAAAYQFHRRTRVAQAAREADEAAARKHAAETGEMLEQGYVAVRAPTDDRELTRDERGVLLNIVDRLAALPLAQLDSLRALGIYRINGGSTFQVVLDELLDLVREHLRLLSFLSTRTRAPPRFF